MVNLNNSYRYTIFKILYKFLKTNTSYKLILSSFLKKSFYTTKDKSNILNTSKGILRNRLILDLYIDSYSSVAANKIDKKTLILLYIGIYELLYCDYIPAYATINTIVDISKKKNYKSHKYINAMLRKISLKKNDVLKKNNYKSKNEELSIKYSFPLWLVDYLLKYYSFKTVEEIFKNSHLIPNISFRVNTIKFSIQKIKDTFEKKGIKYKQNEINKDYFTIDKIGNKIISEMLNNGYIYIQNPASGFIVDYFNPLEGDFILDACSAPGGKSSYINQQTNNNSSLICLENNLNRINKLKANISNLSIENVEFEIADARFFKYRKKFDKILVDVPCSSSGTIRKSPDIKWSLARDHLTNLKNNQYDILNNLSRCLKKNGEIMYSTCSILNDENENIINKFLDKNKNFSIKPCIDKKFKKFINNLGGLTILPIKDEYEGMFAVKMVKND